MIENRANLANRGRPPSSGIPAGAPVCKNVVSKLDQATAESLAGRTVLSSRISRREFADASSWFVESGFDTWGISLVGDETRKCLWGICAKMDAHPENID